MRWFRSWPRSIDHLTEAQHCCVVDNMPRLVMSDYDYRTVEEFDRARLVFGTYWPADQPGFCLLEWDVALDQRSRHRFAGLALMDPYRVLVAPYQLGRAWLPRNIDDTPIAEGQDTAALFGFGCIYLPRSLVDDFLELSIDFTDSGFSRWHHSTHGPARVTWDVHPQHLHEWPDV